MHFLAHVVIDERDVHGPASGTIPALTHWLAGHADWLAAHGDADTWASDAQGWAKQVRRHAYPDRPESQYIGDCPTEVERDGQLGPCGTPVRAHADQPLVTCAGCGTSDTIEWWQAAIVGEQGEIVTGPVLAALLSSRYLRVVDHGTIRVWVHRDKIKRVGKDAKGRWLYDLKAVKEFTDTLWTPVRRAG